MSFPNVDYCIVCDNVRVEAANKLTILGFYGVAPNVEMLFDDNEWGKPIPLVIIIRVSGDTRKFNCTIRLLNPDRSLLAKSDPFDVDLSKRQRHILGQNFFLVFNEQGTYTIQCLMDKQEIFTSTFEIVGPN